MLDTMKSLLSDFDPAALIPDLTELLSHLETVLRICVMAGPLCLLGFGLWYLLAPPPEANHIFGYRFFWGKASVESWQFTQKLAGIAWTVLGVVLTVVMAFRCNGYRDMAYEDMLWSALWSLVWEFGIVAVSILAINITVMVLYDFKGYRRSQKSK